MLMVFGGWATKSENSYKALKWLLPFSQRQLKPRMGFDIPKNIYQTDREDGHKGATAIAAEKDISHT
jgi:hypothetical protein